jgi:hypothetical protein
MIRIAQPALSRLSRAALCVALALALVPVQASAQVATNGPLKTLPQANAPRVQATGTLSAANASVTLPVDGMSTGLIQITGTFAGTLSWFGSVDGGTTYFAINATPFGAGLSGPSVSSATTTGQWELATAPLTHIRATMTAYTSGSAAVVLAATSGAKLSRVRAPVTDPLNVAVVSGGGSGGTVTQGPAGTAPWLMTWGPGLNVGITGSVAVTGTFWQAVQPISGSVTANLGTLNGAALDTSVQQVRTALGTPFQSGGSIGNTAFGISGSLPAFAATPTFNVGTTNGLALDATLTARLGTLGQKASTASAPVVIASDQPALNVNIVGGASSGSSGSITAAGTNGTLAQQVQGITGGVPLPISVASQPLPTGAATSANQTSEITALTTANSRIAVYADATKASYGASATTQLTAHQVPIPGVYTRVSVSAGCSTAATLYLAGSNDGFATSRVYVTSLAIPAGSETGTPTTTTIGAAITTPLAFSWYQAVIVMGGSAGVCTASTSFTAN